MLKDPITIRRQAIQAIPFYRRWSLLCCRSSVFSLLFLLGISSCSVEVVNVDNLNFEGFRGQNSVVIVQLSLEKLSEAIDDLGKEGLSLVDIETYRIKENIFYGAVFHRTSNRTLFTRTDLGPDADWNRFKTVWDKNKGNNLQCMDIEFYQEGSRYVVLSLWRPMNTEVSIRMNIQSGPEFAFVLEEMRKAGNRLSDFEAYGLRNNVFYVTLWRKGPVGEFYSSPRENFISRWQSSPSGLSLVDMEIFRDDDGTRKYAGIWMAGGASEDMQLELDWDNFLKICRQNDERGLLMVDLEIDLNPRGEAVYSGVWSSQGLTR